MKSALVLLLAAFAGAFSPNTAEYVRARVEGAHSRLASPAFAQVRGRFRSQLGGIARMEPSRGTAAINALHAQLDAIEAGGAVGHTTVGYHRTTSARIDRPTRVRAARVERSIRPPVWDSDGRPVFSDAPATAAPRTRARARVEPRARTERPAPRARSAVVSTVAAPTARVLPATFESPRRPGIGERIGRGFERFGHDLVELGDKTREVLGRIVRLPARAVRAFVEDIQGLIEGDRSEARRFATPRLAAGLYKIAEDLRARGAPVMRFGDISKENGGRISGHASHRRGVDADVRLYRTNDGGFDHRMNGEIIRSAMRNMEVEQFYLNQVRIRELCGYWRTAGDPLHGELCRYNGQGAKLRAWRGHTEHVHIRIR